MSAKEFETLNKRANEQGSGAGPGPLEEGVKIDGLQQVIEMLRHADPQFRESLLKRLTSRDPKLAQSLKRFIR